MRCCEFRHEQCMYRDEMSRVLNIVTFAVIAVLTSTAGYEFAQTDNRAGMTFCAQQLTRMTEGRDESGASRRKAPGSWYFYLQRQYGNSGINVDNELTQAAKALSTDNRPSHYKRASEAPWTFLGPANIGGRMRAIAFHPTNTDIVYAGSASGGVFKMSDGERWVPVSDFTVSLPIGALAIDQNDPDIIVAGTGEPVVQTPWSIGSPSYLGVGVLKSYDAGQSWTVLPYITNVSAIHKILLSPESSDTMLVASTANLLKTTDNGENWTVTLNGTVTDLEYLPDNPNTVFAAVGNDTGSPANGVYRSFANGNKSTWKKLSDNFPAGDSLGRIIISTTPADPKLILAFLSHAMDGVFPVWNDFFGIMKSTDAGDSWVRLDNNLHPSSFGRGQLFYNFCSVISPTDPDLVYAGGINVWSSTNGGEFWLQASDPFSHHVDQHALEFQPGTDVLWVCNDGGIRTRSDRDGWAFLQDGLETVQYYTITADPVSPWLIFGGSQDNGTQRMKEKDSKIWKDVLSGDGGYVLIDPTNPQIVFAKATVFFAPYRSINGGDNWSIIDEGLGGTDPSEFPSWISPMLLHPADPSKLYTASQYLYLADSANVSSHRPNFTLMSDDYLARGGEYTSVVTTMAISESNPNYMYVGSGDGNVFRCRNLLDGPGMIGWDDVSVGTPRKWITRLEVDPRNEHIVYATFSGFRTAHVMRSSNDGNDWVDISSNLPDIPVNCIKVDQEYSKVLYIATDLGVWYSTNTGDSWERYGEGLPNVVVHDLDFNSEGYIIAGTYGRGAWAAPRNEVSAKATPLPSDLLLAQNYPNPVHTGKQASIVFSTVASAETSIRLYDAQGKHVLNLYEGRASAGLQTVSISTAGVSPGIYYYRLTSGSEMLTRKMLVIE
jgi:photosystem II stability/assembly factor-like uncharacterized protein